MRITNSIILRGYNRNLNRLATMKHESENRITTTRKFCRASQNPLAAAKALDVRRSLYNLAQYEENLKTANTFYTEAETTLLQVSDKMAEVRETLIAACNTTRDNEEYEIYSEQLETIAKELVSIFNTDSAGRAIFGGESDDSLPFTIQNDSTGHASTILYHGVPVNALSDYKSFPYSTPVTIDIGLGMAMDQKTQEVNEQSVLDISFNGAKITGCGAERGTADVDLSSIKPDRKYCLDVFVGSYKKTIEFTGQTTYEDNVTEINNALAEAFKKEVAYDKIKQPTMDDRGIIYSAGSVVNAVNNTDHKTAEKLGVDNDSGYTNKYKLNFASLEDGQEYSLDVTMGSITKSIKFRASTEADTTKRELETIENVQAELDKAFGLDENGISRVSVATNEVTRGVFSAEGEAVSVQDSMKLVTSSNTVKGATVNSEHYDQIDLVKLNNGTTYTVKVNGSDVVFKGGATIEETRQNLQAAVGGAGTVSQVMGDKKSVCITVGDTHLPITQISEKQVASGQTAIKPTKGATYTVDLDTITEGSEYSLKVVYNNRAKIISFVGGADKETTVKNIQGELTNAFGLTGKHSKISIDEDGVVTTYDGNPVAVTSMEIGSADDPKASVRDVIYSNNYIQLTLDAARALREGDIDYANGCIDKIVSANEHLLVQIADLGCNEDFIDFNLEKFTTRELNLSERQNDLEITNLEEEITLWKTYEALYNACLQMSSSVIPNSIFNYIR